MAVGRAEITVVADASEFDRQMRGMADAMSRAFTGAERDATRSFGNTERASRRFASALGNVRDRLRRVRSGLAEAFGSADQFRGAVRRLTDRVRESGGGLRRMGEAGRQLGSVLGRTIGIMGRVAAAGAAVGTIAGALGAAAAAGVQFTAALAPAAGAIAGLPAVVGVAGAAIATLQVALSGVGDAFSAAATGNAEEFAEAIEGLAPSAQAAAGALREITPLFSTLRESVQQAFFEGFDQTLLDIGATLAGPLQAGMTSAAASVGSLVNSLGEVATSGAGVAFIESSFASLTGIVDNLQGPLANLFAAFLDLGTAVNVAFGGEAAGAGLAAMIDQFAEFISAAAESGRAVGWVEGAMTVFSQLGAIISPIVGIIASVGQVAQDTGGNVLGAMGSALGAVEAFISSAEGMATLTVVFETLNEVGSVFGAVLSGLLPVIAPLVGQLVSGLLPVLQSLVPVIVQIGELAAPIFSQILEAVLPLIPPLLTLVSQVLPIAAQLFSLLVAAAAPLLEVLVNLLTSVLEPLLPALEPILLIFGELAVTLAEILTPVIQLIGEILLWLVDTIIVPIVVPIIEFLADLFATLLSGAVEDFAEFFTAQIDAIVAVATFLKDKWDENALFMRVAFRLLQDKFKAGADFIRDKVFAPIRSAAGTVRDTLSGIWSKVKSGFASVADFFEDKADAIGDALSGIWDAVKGAYNALASGWNRIDISIGPFSIPDWVPIYGGRSFHIADIIPDIPRLQSSGFSFGTGLVQVHPNEAIVNARDPRGLRMLADALDRAGATDGGFVIESGAVTIEFSGAMPDQATARRVGEAAADGLMRTLAGRAARIGVRQIQATRG